VVLKDQHIEGFGQNIVLQQIRSATLDNVVSANAWRDELPKKPDGSGGPNIFDGQALYTQDISGTLKVSNYMAYRPGWQENRPLGSKSMFHHGWYGNFGLHDVTLDTCILFGASMAGLQPRISGTLTAHNCVILACGAGLEAVMGHWKLDHCTIYDGRQMTPDGGASWTGGLAARVYWPGAMNDVWVVGAPNQAAPPQQAAGAKAFPQGAIAVGGLWEGRTDHPLWKPPPAGEPLLTATNCAIAGWPTDDHGNLFTGGYNGAGFAQRQVHGAFDYMPILDNILKDQTASISNAVDQLHKGIRGLVT
jgi:hypothetical protein